MRAGRRSACRAGAARDGPCPGAPLRARSPRPTVAPRATTTLRVSCPSRVRSIPEGSAPQAASRRKPLGREAECLRELAGKALVANDEGKLHDLRLTEVLDDHRPALGCSLIVVADASLRE